MENFASCYHHTKVSLASDSVPPSSLGLFHYRIVLVIICNLQVLPIDVLEDKYPDQTHIFGVASEIMLV